MVIYVNASAERDGNGSKEMPFKHINTAAQVAMPGDEVVVAPGIYREYVDPKNAGREDARIVYRSEEPLGAIITGAEEVKILGEISGQRLGMPDRQQRIRKLQPLYHLRGRRLVFRKI